MWQTTTKCYIVVKWNEPDMNLFRPFYFDNPAYNPMQAIGKLSLSVIKLNWVNAGVIGGVFKNILKENKDLVTQQTDNRESFRENQCNLVVKR